MALRSKIVSIKRAADAVLNLSLEEGLLDFDYNIINAPLSGSPTLNCKIFTDFEQKGSKSTLFAIRKFRGHSVGKCLRYLFFVVFCGAIIFNILFSSETPTIPVSQPLKLSQQYSIVVNTFRRVDMLERFIKHYSQCARIESIHVVWGDISISPPTAASNPKLYSSSKPVFYHLQQEDSLNNRFRPLENLQTEAIFSADDDMIVPCGDLDFAFEVWRNSPNTMVGFMPRTHSSVKSSNSLHYAYNCWWKVWWDGSYSMILTKAAFLHRKFLDLYTHRMPAKIREYVDEKKNCEDIAMSFLIANSTGLPPVYVRGNLKDYGAINGISTKKWTKGSHMRDRTTCLNKMVEFYDGNIPLVKGRVIAAPAQSWLINQPSTWFEYFSSDILLMTSKRAESFSSQVVKSSSTSVAVLLGLLVTSFATF